MDVANQTASVMDHLHASFSWYDYTLFSLMLGLSTVIGIYFGFFEKKQESANEYLLGGREMKVIPIAISLTASNISGITLLAVPTDVYRFGATYWVYCISMIFICLATYYVYLPVFYKLQLTSTYEYLKLRFDGRIRILSSFLFTVSNLLYLPIVVFIPALAFSQATGVNVHLVTPLVCGICIFYTTIGGLKAVVWTDTLQFFIMMGSIIGVFYMGLISVGGFKSMWNKSIEGERIFLDLDVTPTKRDTFISTLIGTTFGGLSYISVGQGSVQKYLSMPTIKNARNSIILFTIGMITIITLTVITGLIMYVRYADCDPFASGKISQHDQILPFYVLDVASTIPGLSGLFLSGIFSAALSTLSATMNCLAGSVYEDFVSPFMAKDITQKKVSNILKLIVMIIGVISTAGVFLVERMGSILPIQFTLGGITSGPLFGLFSLGMLFPQANAKGALWGGIGSLAIMSYIIIGAQLKKAKGLIKFIPKPISIDGCSPNATILPNIMEEMFAETDPENEVFALFRLSYYYYIFLGTMLVIIIGLIVSMLTKSDADPKTDRDLISPVSQWMITETTHKNTFYNNVDTAFKIIDKYPENEKC